LRFLHGHMRMAGRKRDREAKGRESASRDGDWERWQWDVSVMDSQSLGQWLVGWWVKMAVSGRFES
jgi:hypothetical protein